MRFDAVFFDSGGTLYSDLETGSPTHSEVVAGQIPRVQAALQGFGIDVDVVRLTDSMKSCAAEGKKRLGVGYNFYQLMIAVCRDLKLDLGPEEAACLADAYAGPRYKSWLLLGTKETVRKLSEKGLYLGVIANTRWPGFCMDRAFTGVGLLPYFKTRVYSGDLGITKPDPRIFRYAEEVAGLHGKGKAILYVGNDLEVDVKGASNAGWSTAFRSSGDSGSDGLADLDFDETPELLAFILGK